MNQYDAWFFLKGQFLRTIFSELPWSQSIFSTKKARIKLHLNDEFKRNQNDQNIELFKEKKTRCREQLWTKINWR